MPKATAQVMSTYKVLPSLMESLEAKCSRSFMILKPSPKIPVIFFFALKKDTRPCTRTLLQKPFQLSKDKAATGRDFLG